MTETPPRSQGSDDKPRRDELSVPALSLVVLIGQTQSEVFTFGRTHFAQAEMLSIESMPTEDETHESAGLSSFDVLRSFAERRLAAGLLTLIDASDLERTARVNLVALAREHDVLPVAILLDPFKPLRGETGAPTRQELRREGFRAVHLLESEAKAGEITVTRTRLPNDFRHETGPFDVIGDVHGCRRELEILLAELGYLLERDKQDRVVLAHHPERRRAVFVGDLVDRGPDTPGVLRLGMAMVAAGEGLCVSGNHENKLLRALRGRNVQVTHGLAESLAQLAEEPTGFRQEVERFLDGLISHYVLDGGRLVVAHAGLPEKLHGRTSERVRQFCLYGQSTGETDEFGLPVRYPWADAYRGTAMVVYGHTPVPMPEWVNKTLCLDTGCVFGGQLTALRYPERELVRVPAAKVYYKPAKPFLESSHSLIP